MAYLKAYDKEGNLIAVGEQAKGDKGYITLKNLEPHKKYEQGSFTIKWVSDDFETEGVGSPEFSTHDSEYKEFMFYTKDILKVQGLSAYQIAVKNGYTGTEEEWVQSIKGEPGVDADPEEVKTLLEPYAENIAKQEFEKLSTAKQVDSEVINARGDFDNLSRRLDFLNSTPVYASNYGVSFENSAENNTVSLKEALSIAENEKRPLVLPTCPADTFIDINDVIVSEKNSVNITGWGHSTRIRQINFPKGIFVLNGDYSYAGNFDVFGVPFDAKGMGSTHGENTGVMILGNYSTVENIYGDTISTVVKSSPTEIENQVVGNKYLNIESGENVVFNFVIGNSKDCYFDNIVGSYSNLAETPPHLIYVDHFYALNYNLTGGNCRAYNGKSSFAYQLKGCIDSNIGSLYSENCVGNLHLSASKNVNIKEVVSKNDTSKSTQGAGAMAIDESSENVLISKYVINSITNSKQLSINETCKNIKILDADITLNTDKYVELFSSINIGSVDIAGQNCMLVNPKVKNIGEYVYTNGIFIRNCDNTTIINPEISGFEVGITFNGTGSNTLVKDVDIKYLNEYNNRPFSSWDEGVGKIQGKYVNTDIEYYDKVTTTLFFNPNASIPQTTSGHKWESLQGVVYQDLEKKEYYVKGQPQSGTLAVIDLNNSNCNVSADVKASGEAQEGLAVRVKDNNNYISARIDNETGQAIIFKRQDSVNTTIDSKPFTSQKGRKYNQKLVAYGNQIDYYIDNTLTLSTVLDEETTNLFKDNTKHGLRMRAKYNVENSGGISNIVWNEM